MSDGQTPHSGSRWEPDGGASSEQSEPTEIEATAEQPAASPPSPDHEEASRTDRWTSRLRGRGALAASGIGLAAISGLGGFALGHATAGDGSDSRFVRTDMESGGVPRPGTEGGFRGRLHGDEGNMPPGMPGDGPPSDGTVPPDGSSQSDQGRQDDDTDQSS
jgi:hypothetical protein